MGLSMNLALGLCRRRSSSPISPGRAVLNGMTDWWSDEDVSGSGDTTLTSRTGSGIVTWPTGGPKPSLAAGSVILDGIENYATFTTTEFQNDPLTFAFCYTQPASQTSSFLIGAAGGGTATEWDLYTVGSGLYSRVGITTRSSPSTAFAKKTVAVVTSTRGPSGFKIGRRQAGDGAITWSGTTTDTGSVLTGAVKYIGRRPAGTYAAISFHDLALKVGAAISDVEAEALCDELLGEGA